MPEGPPNQPLHLTGRVPLIGGWLRWRCQLRYPRDGGCQPSD